MISSDTPWSGLEAGKTDTRRVSATARWNWFWAVISTTDVALVLALRDLPRPTPDLPKLKNLDIQFQTLSSGPILYNRLRDGSHRELFETLCRDVMAAGESAETEPEALKRAIQRTFRWHHLLRGGSGEGLSAEEQRGLIGEIQILRLLIATLGAKTAIAAWTGPSGAPKDFELESDCIEVKARRGASQPFVSIRNEHQLAEVPDRRLWLAVLAVDKVQPPFGKTLNDYVSELKEDIEQTDPSVINSLEIRLAEVGFDSIHDYRATCWIASPPEVYQIRAGFPRIPTPISIGITNVSYSIDLRACGPFLTDWETVQENLIQGGSG